MLGCLEVGLDFGFVVLIKFLVGCAEFWIFGFFGGVQDREPSRCTGFMVLV